MALITEHAVVNVIKFSPDGKTIAGANLHLPGGNARFVHFWDAETGRHKHTLNHTDDILDFVFSPDGNTFATVAGRAGSTVRLWDVSTGKHTQSLDVYKWTRAFVGSLVFSPDGRTLVMRGSNSSIRLWDTKTGRHTQTLTEHTDTVDRVAFSPDGKILLCYGGKSLTLWDAKTGALKHVLEQPSRLYSADFSPDSKTIAIRAMSDRSVHLWDVRTGEHIRTLAGHTRKIHSVMFSPDGKTLTTGSYGGTLRLWDTQTGRHRHTLTLDADPALFDDMMFSPDGKRFVGGSHDGTLRVWGANTGIHTHTLTGHTDRINAIVFSPDSRTLATTCCHGTLRLWDVRTGEHIRTLFLDRDADPNIFFSVAFSPDGKRLATAIRSDDRYAVHFWDVKTGKRTHTFTGHTRTIYSVAFSPDGKLLATASRDGTVLLWDVLRTLEIYEHSEK